MRGPGRVGRSRPRARVERLALVACATLAACASGSGSLATIERTWPPPSIADVLAIRAPGSPRLAPDGTLYVRDWPDGINQLYRYAPGHVGEEGARCVRLSNFADGLSSYSLSPDGRRIVLASARGGNEQDQLSVIETARTDVAGTGTPVCANPDVVHRLHDWLADGAGFLYSANDASASDFHLYRFDFDAADGARGRSTKLLAREGSWSVQDATDDGARVLVSRFVSESQAEAYELDAATGALRPLDVRAADEATTNNACVAYLPGERAVLLTSDSGGPLRLWMRDLDGGAPTRPIAALDGYELDQAEANERRDLLGLVTNEDGYGVLRVYRLPSFEPVPLPPIEKGVVALAQMSGDTVVWTLSNARTPGLSFAYEVPPPGRRPRETPAARQLTFADARGVDVARFALPELVRYRSFDGLEIPAFLHLPESARRGSPVPFVVHFHGGPEGQHRPGFDRATQILVSRGFGVLQPNVRGSTGYGRAFHRLDDVAKRWDSVRDGVEAARWLVREGLASPRAIAAYGGSYGGFMSVATVLEGPDVFGAAVDVVGIVDFRTFLAGTKGYRRKLREAEYGSLDDPSFLASISPLVRADEIAMPMLIAHGLNDPRVPVGEAMQLAVSLQSRGHDPELLFFPDEGHGFQKLGNRVVFTERMVGFLERTIGRGPRSAAAEDRKAGSAAGPPIEVRGALRGAAGAAEGAAQASAAAYASR